jgi:membrane associated rhomboid family serine protease
MEMVTREAARGEPTPYFTFLLLILMLGVHVILWFIPTEGVLRIYETYSLFPVRLFNSILLDTLVTYLFLHGNWAHLLINCVALAGSGFIVEKDIGHAKFIIAFFASGIAAGLAHSILHPSSSVPLIGASGAIFGIIAILFLLMPFKITYALVIPLPSVLVGIMLSIVELYSLWVPTDVTIAHDAHISGFIFGCLYAFIIDRKRALKGLIVAIVVLAIIYYIGWRYGII